LSFAYTRRVGGKKGPCRRDRRRPDGGYYTYTAKRKTLGAVVTKRTPRVLGLGNIGPLAAKPVNDGRAKGKRILFKASGTSDVFDRWVGVRKTGDMIGFVRLLPSTTRGRDQSRDIRSPACVIHRKDAAATPTIPVFMTNQHGTAIIHRVAAADQRVRDGCGRRTSERVQRVRLQGAEAPRAIRHRP